MSSRFPQLNRLIITGCVLALLSGGLAGCGSNDGAETIRFTFSKREAIPYMRDVVDAYNSSQDKVKVTLDTSGVDPVSASFVRGNPPDVALANYNMETSRFVERCALTDLSDTGAAQRMNRDLQPLMDQYGKCSGRLSAIPYSVMASGVIYNKDIFAKYGLEVPQTWDELIRLCETLKANGVTPFEATYSVDTWTIGQHWFDYALGGQMNIIKFFDELASEGANVGPKSAVSFQKSAKKPVEQMLALTDKYVNTDAPSLTYGDGNLAFARGKAAMYPAGPWVFSELAKTDPHMNLGSFPLPMTNNPDDLAVRVNLDLAGWIPEKSRHKEAARDFLEYLYRPEIIKGYNTSQSGITPTRDAGPVTDPHIEGVAKYYEKSQFYQGPSVLLPKTIPVFNYVQGMVLGDGTDPLKTIDADWARIALRQ